MYDLFKHSPREMGIISSVILVFLGGLVYGWLHSNRTRKLTKFAVLLLLALAIVVIAGTIVRLLWFPFPRV
jgi:hypothetical protein